MDSIYFWLFLLGMAVLGWYLFGVIVPTNECYLPETFHQLGRTMKSGFWLRWPWTKFRKYSTRWKLLKDTVTARAGDGAVVKATIKFYYKVDPDNNFRQGERAGSLVYASFLPQDVESGLKEEGGIAFRTILGFQESEGCEESTEL